MSSIWGFYKPTTTSTRPIFIATHFLFVLWKNHFYDDVIIFEYTTLSYDFSFRSIYIEIVSDSGNYTRKKHVLELTILFVVKNFEMLLLAFAKGFLNVITDSF